MYIFKKKCQKHLYHKQVSTTLYKLQNIFFRQTPAHAHCGWIFSRFSNDQNCKLPSQRFLLYRACTAHIDLDNTVVSLKQSYLVFCKWYYGFTFIHTDFGVVLFFLLCRESAKLFEDYIQSEIYQNAVINSQEIRTFFFAISLSNYFLSMKYILYTLQCDFRCMYRYLNNYSNNTQNHNLKTYC